jgi:glucokinase
LVPQSIGVDLGGTKCLGVLLDDRGSVVAEHRVHTPVGADAIVDAIAEIAKELGPGLPVGVGAPGLITREGVLRFAPNLPGVVEVPLRALLVERLGVDVEIENDATAACWAEHEVGAAQGADDAVMATLGTGIGGGLVVDGRLARGANGFAGEIGHMVVDPDGPPCPCGKRGCWERFASGSGLGRLARERGIGERGEEVTAAAIRGDAAAVAVMAEFAHWVALGLVNLAYLLDPELFVLGGGMVACGSVLLDPVRAAFTELLAGAGHRPTVRVEQAALGERAGAIGAALLARGR